MACCSRPRPCCRPFTSPQGGHTRRHIGFKSRVQLTGCAARGSRRQGAPSDGAQVGPPGPWCCAPTGTPLPTAVGPWTPTPLQLAANAVCQHDFPAAPAAALSSALILANSQLHDSPIDDCLSGTTACCALLAGRTLHMANVGDSRAVLGEGPAGGPLTARDLSKDQTPFRCGRAAEPARAAAAAGCMAAGARCSSAPGRWPASVDGAWRVLPPVPPLPAPTLAMLWRQPQLWLPPVLPGCLPAGRTSACA